MPALPGTRVWDLWTVVLGTGPGEERAKQKRGQARQKTGCRVALEASKLDMQK